MWTCCKPGNSNITKVNRTKHKKSRDALRKRIAHGPLIFSSLKEVALSDLCDLSNLRQTSSDSSSLASYFQPPFPPWSPLPLFIGPHHPTWLQHNAQASAAKPHAWLHHPGLLGCGLSNLSCPLMLTCLLSAPSAWTPLQAPKLPSLYTTQIFPWF